MTALDFVRENDKGGDPWYFLRSQRTVWLGDRSSSRWWDDIFRVVEVGDRLIGYWDAETTGDDTPGEKGWEFDENTICFVEPYDHIETRYRSIEKAS